ncbi:hypothetical protein ACFQZR_15225 [Paenibacillus sp. GCM10027629]|uniref:hypothetical protein n=1 Tax=Paenibacillus sp. GCM10027629 TaxID=3273414 RepID=UPI0036359AC5
MQPIHKLLEVLNDRMDMLYMLYMLYMLKVTYLPHWIYLDSKLLDQHNQLIHFNRR